MKEKIETELVKEDDSWWVYVVVNGKRSNFALGSDVKEHAERDKKRIEEDDLYDTIVNADWYKEMLRKSSQIILKYSNPLLQKRFP